MFCLIRIFAIWLDTATFHYCKAPKKTIKTFSFVGLLERRYYLSCDILILHCDLRSLKPFQQDYCYRSGEDRLFREVRTWNVTAREYDKFCEVTEEPASALSAYTIVI